VNAIPGEMYMLQASHPAIKDIKSFEIAETFCAAKKDNSFDSKLGLPYLIKGSLAMDAFSADRMVKATVGLFRIQYPTSDAATNKKRGQNTFQNEKKERCRELLLGHAPATLSPIPSGDRANVYAKSIEHVSLYGCSPGLNEIEMERQGLAQIRHQFAGERSLVIVPYSVAQALLSEEGRGMRPDEDFLAYVGDRLRSVDKDTLDKLAADGHSVTRAIVSAGSVYYVPPASFVFDKVIGGKVALGFRTALLDASPSARQELEALTTGMAAKHADHAQVKLWRQVLDNFMKTSEAPSASKGAPPSGNGVKPVVVVAEPISVDPKAAEPPASIDLKSVAPPNKLLPKVAKPDCVDLKSAKPAKIA
jgi:hypothetical protein